MTERCRIMHEHLWQSHLSLSVTRNWSFSVILSAQCCKINGHIIPITLPNNPFSEAHIKIHNIRKHHYEIEGQFVCKISRITAIRHSDLNVSPNFILRISKIQTTLHIHLAIYKIKWAWLKSNRRQRYFIKYKKSYTSTHFVFQQFLKQF